MIYGFWDRIQNRAHAHNRRFKITNRHVWKSEKGGWCHVFRSTAKASKVTLQWYWEGWERVLNRVFVKRWASFFLERRELFPAVLIIEMCVCEHEIGWGGANLPYLLGLALWEFLVDHLLLEDPEGENTHTKPCLAFQCEIILAELLQKHFLNKDASAGEPLSCFD